MDVTGTIKVNHSRAYHAFRNALSDLDRAMPEMLTEAGIIDARREAERVAEAAAWNAKVKDKQDRTLAWAEYDQKVAARAKTLREHRGWRPAPVEAHPTEPNFPRPDRDYSYSGYDRPPAKLHEYETCVYCVQQIRVNLKKRLDVAGMAMAPYRVTYDDAAFIASCEDGSYVEKVKAQKGWIVNPRRGRGSSLASIYDRNA